MRNGQRQIVRLGIPIAVAAVAGLTAAVVVLTAGNATPDRPGTGPTARPVTTPTAGPAAVQWAAAPYLYLGAGGPPPAEIMKATGIRRFVVAFITSDGGCGPAWDDSDPLLGGREEAAVRAIRAAGGDAAVSFGGMGGTKLALTCSSPGALAGVYQKVIDAYRFRAIDVDAEDAEISSAVARERIVGALAIVRRAHPGLTVSVTIGANPDGPGADGKDLIGRAAAAGLRIDAWTIMPFDFAARVPDMGRASVQAAEGLKADLMNAYHEPASAAYQTMGISSANGRTDTGEIIRLADFQTILRYAQTHHLARLTFWSADRDRPCTQQTTTADTCSGIAQTPYAFSKVIAGYRP